MKKIVDKARRIALILTFSFAHKFMQWRNYFAAMMLVNIAYRLADLSGDPAKSAPQLNLTCARIAALSEKWDLAVERAMLANEQLLEQTKLNPNDIKYLRYFAKNIIDHCAYYTKNPKFLNFLSKIDVDFASINIHSVRKSTMVMFQIEEIDEGER